MVPKTIIRAPDKRTGKEYSHIYFSTRSLPCFLEPAALGGGGLAYWICDDGLWDNHCRRVVLCTDSFLVHLAGPAISAARCL